MEIDKEKVEAGKEKAMKAANEAKEKLKGILADDKKKKIFFGAVGAVVLVMIALIFSGGDSIPTLDNLTCPVLGSNWKEEGEGKFVNYTTDHLFVSKLEVDYRENGKLVEFFKGALTCENGKKVKQEMREIAKKKGFETFYIRASYLVRQKVLVDGKLPPEDKTDGLGPITTNASVAYMMMASGQNRIIADEDFTRQTRNFPDPKVAMLVIDRCLNELSEELANNKVLQRIIK